MPAAVARALPGLGLFIILLAHAAPADGQDRPPVQVEVDGVLSRNNSTVKHKVESQSGEPTTQQLSSAGRAPRTRAVGEIFYATFPTLDTAADGTSCIRVRRRAYSTQAAARSAEDTENLLWRLAAASFPLCPRTPAPANTPAAQAAEYWRVVGEDELPRPDPDIQPGFMLAGKLAYLEAGTVPSARFENPTPAGVLTIEATAQTYVDWGDGSAVDGPFDHPGGPWPHGTITHYWTEIGHYDIRVVQRWTGRWSLGAESGELAGLETVGVIDDFPIEELQAVINRG